MSAQRRSKPSDKAPSDDGGGDAARKLDLWLQAEPAPPPPICRCSMASSTAIVAGPVSMDPRDWICPLLGVAREAFNHGGTRNSRQYRPSRSGITSSPTRSPRTSRLCTDLRTQTERRYRCGFLVQGFYAAIQLKPSAWAPLLTKDGIESGLLLPILFHCVDRNGRPLIPSAPIGAKVDMLRRSAHTAIPAAVELTRQYWMPTRFKTRP